MGFNSGFKGLNKQRTSCIYLKTFRWPSPFCSRPKEQTRILQSPDAASAQCQRNVQLSTPPQAWYKITGPYSPLRSQLYEGNMDPVCKYSSK